MNINEDKIHEVLTQIQDKQKITASKKETSIALTYFAIMECLVNSTDVCFLSTQATLVDTFKDVLEYLQMDGEFTHRNHVLNIQQNCVYFMWNSDQALNGSTYIEDSSDPKVIREFFKNDLFLRPNNDFFDAITAWDKPIPDLQLNQSVMTNLHNSGILRNPTPIFIDTA